MRDDGLGTTCRFGSLGGRRASCLPTETCVASKRNDQHGCDPAQGDVSSGAKVDMRGNRRGSHEAKEQRNEVERKCRNAKKALSAKGTSEREEPGDADGVPEAGSDDTYRRNPSRRRRQRYGGKGDRESEKEVVGKRMSRPRAPR